MRDYLEALEPDAIAALRRLVEVNSYTHNREGVRRVGAMCEEMFEPLGFSARRVRSVMPTAGDHLVLTHAGGGDATLVLVAHLDTVFPPERERDDRFAWREEGDWIHGPGVCDMKGGIVLMWMVLRALREREPELFARTTFKLLFNASEEGGCSDFPPLARAEVRGRVNAVFVFEPGMEDEPGVTTLADSRKGCGRFRVETFGREAHSGQAHQRGASAIRELARVIERIEEWTEPDSGLTFSVGRIDGGTAVNTVPGRAGADVDMRAWTPEQFERGKKKVLSLAGEGSVRSRDGGYACRIEVAERPGYPPWPNNPAGEALRERAVRIGRGLGLELAVPRRGGGSDACHLWDLAPTLDGLGPVGRNGHCSVHDPQRGLEQESVLRTSFLPRALLSIELIREVSAS